MSPNGDFIQGKWNEIGVKNKKTITANYDSGEIVLHSHKNAEWISVNQLTQYEFAPADKPIVQKLIKETNR